MKQAFFQLAVFCVIICGVWGLPVGLETGSVGNESEVAEGKDKASRLVREASPEDNGSYHGEGSNSPGQAYLANDSASLSASPGVATMTNPGASVVYTPGQIVYTVGGKVIVANQKK